MSKVAALGCIACHKIGYSDTPAEIHHIRQGTERRNHFKVIPLCPYHHRQGKNAIHQSKASFEADFGTEQELLAQVNEMVAA